MNQKIFSMNLDVETVSLYLLCCAVADTGQKITLSMLHEKWNGDQSALERELERLKKRISSASSRRNRAVIPFTDWSMKSIGNNVEICMFHFAWSRPLETIVRRTQAMIRSSGTSVLIPGQEAAIACQLPTSTRTLEMNGHLRHMVGFTGWMVQTLSQKTQ